MKNFLIDLFYVICFHLEPVDSAAKILDWLLEQIEGDAIEDVTDEMLEKLVSGHLAGNGYCESYFVFHCFSSLICHSL